MNDFYVYAHRRADDSQLFYIGKGRGRRAHYKHGRSQYWTRIAEKHGFVVEMLATGLSEDDAFAIEKELIAQHDGLCNMTDGGDGISGYRHSDETRAALSRAHKGRAQDPAVIEARATKLRGKKRTPEQIAANKRYLPGWTASDETKAKMSKSRMGRKNSPESIEKTASKHRGVKRSEESKRRMSNASSVKRGVRCIDSGIEYSSLEAAAIWMQANGFPKATRTGIWLAATGRYKKSYGYRWEYV